MAFVFKFFVLIATVVGTLQQTNYYSAPKYIDIAMNTSVYPSSKVSYVQVYGPSGTEASIGDCDYISQKTMRIRIRDDGPGTYIVFWHVLSTDDMLESQGVRTFVVYEFSLTLMLPYV